MIKSEISETKLVSSLDWEEQGQEARRTSRKVLDEELSVVSQTLSVKGVQHGVSSSIGSGSAAVSLSSLSVLERLSTESTLVNLSFRGPGEGETVVLEFENGRSWRAKKER